MKINKRNKKFFSPYNPVKKGEWKGYYNSADREWIKEESNKTKQSKVYIKEIKRLDEENEKSRKLLEEKLLSSESSSAVQEKERLKEEIDQIKEEINEKNIRKNKIITDLQIHRLEEGYGNCGTEKAERNLCTPGNADYILHTYVIQCINRLKYPWFGGRYEPNDEIISKEITISDEETNALEFIKENISIEQPIKEYYRKNALFEEIKDMPIIPTDFAWLLDERIVKGKESSDSIIENKTRNYKLFGKGIEKEKYGRTYVNAKPTIFGIISFDENEKNKDLELRGDKQYISEVAYKIFLKIWTANVIAKYIFKIYHEVEYSHIYGEIYPTIGEIMPEEEKEKIKKIEDAAKEATAQKTASPAQRPAQHPTEQTLDNNSSTP